MIFKRKPKLIPQVRRLSLEPGDSLLVTVPSSFGMEQCARIREAFAGNLDGVNVLVVNDSLDVAVVRPEPHPKGQR